MGSLSASKYTDEADNSFSHMPFDQCLLNTSEEPPTSSCLEEKQADFISKEALPPRQPPLTNPSWKTPDEVRKFSVYRAMFLYICGDEAPVENSRWKLNQSTSALGNQAYITSPCSSRWNRSKLSKLDLGCTMLVSKSHISLTSQWYHTLTGLLLVSPTKIYHLS